MKRPSFQFYPGDWAANPNLKRCTFAEKGIWLEVMCLMHDQAEYGVLRWPLKEVAEAVKCRAAELQALVRKGVLKGDDKQLETPFIYIPRSGRKDGDPITLIPIQAGPVWYSSRMVKDEHVRIKRGENDGNGAAPKQSPDDAPKVPIGEGIGPRGSSSSSSPSGKEKEIPPLRGGPLAKPAAARGSRLPSDWDPGESGTAFAEQQGLRNGRSSAELAKFRDYWSAQPGQKGVKADWQATWRNWVRKAVETAPTAGKRPPDDLGDMFRRGVS